MRDSTLSMNDVRCMVPTASVICHHRLPEQRAAGFFCKESDSEYFSLCWLHRLYRNFSILLLQHKNNRR